MFDHPQVAYRTCASCRKWQYNEQTGKAAVTALTNLLGDIADNSVGPAASIEVDGVEVLPNN